MASALRAPHRPAQSCARIDASRPPRAGIPCCRALQAGPRSRIASCAADPMPRPLPANDEDIAFAPVTQLSRWIEQRKLTSERLTDIYLERLERFNPKLRCVITLTRDLALKQAKQADDEIAAGKYRGPLHGIPWGGKGSARHRRHSHHLRRRALSRPRARRGRRGRAAAARRRRGAGRQAQPGRAGAERHLVRRPDHESVAAGRRLVGIERRARARRPPPDWWASRSAAKPAAASSARRCAAASPDCGRPTAACRAPAR